MHKTQCDHAQDSITYQILPSGRANVWLRGEATEIVTPAMEEGGEDQVSYEQDEVFFTVDAFTLTKEEIVADIDFFFAQMADHEGESADHLEPGTFRIAKHNELSAICSAQIMAGIDVPLTGGTEHFSLTEKDQLNLFGKQAQLATGATRLEYHQDGEPCKYYSAEDMTAIIQKAMEWVSYHTTYCNSMFTWLNACTKPSEMAAITYGAEIPEEYQSEVYKDYIRG